MNSPEIPCGGFGRSRVGGIEKCTPSAEALWCVEFNEFDSLEVEVRSEEDMSYTKAVLIECDVQILNEFLSISW